MSQLYDKVVAQTLTDISGALKEGAKLLGTSVTGAGRAHADSESAEEPWVDHTAAVGHTCPSTPHSDRVVGGKGKDKASEHSTHDDGASIEPPYEDTGLSTPEAADDDEYLSEDKSHIQTDGKESPPLWSDMEDSGDLGPVPSFEHVCPEDLQPQQSIDEYIFENIELCCKHQMRCEKRKQYILSMESDLQSQRDQIMALQEALKLQAAMNTPVPEVGPIANTQPTEESNEWSPQKYSKPNLTSG
ncbi:hypothetical protein P691DRAFT_768953 [Macrolepiota fuliginosa MF-IS2]|uniref:Uncharacterized protein n=1 Tax=Macrolepiota fuliginosa MF-IS2 TaxID=1400762 RepID=A0A9P5WW52_9AGAR|nr:hypothetical protein P691DRAFT_768953 [Macrolepiota fuliginosa MF-IS2]